MIIAGLQKMTLIDYPDKIACTVFTHGCNFRCPFCHNPELVTKPLKKGEIFSKEEFFKFLKQRKKMLDGVVITGGEPCLHKGLLEFARRIKEDGFLVKVDTNGSFPERLEELLKEGVVDYIAMDIKSGLDEYNNTTGSIVEIKKILKSIELIKNSNVKHEFRTTVVRGMHTKDSMKKIGELLKGTKDFSLQNFKFSKSISSEFSKKNEFSSKELEEFGGILEKYIGNVYIKNIN